MKGDTMKMKINPLVVATALVFATPAVAHDIHETVVTNFAHAIPNLPGKSLVAVEVNYPPGGSSRPHRHAKSAFIYAYVVSGTIESRSRVSRRILTGPARASSRPRARIMS
jgi:quercetin dioxygenase-like cupin family protein